MAKNVKLLLTETVDNLGIVGDLVSVRTGYARNYLLPRSLATKPSDEAVAAVAAKRAEAQRLLAEERKVREAMIQKMVAVEVVLTRSCNDQKVLYGAVTQQDIADALKAQGYDVKPREVRLGQVIKRIDSYDVQVKLDSDLVTTVKLRVEADRKIEVEEKPDLDFDNEGNLIVPGSREARRAAAKSREAAERAASAPTAEAAAEKPVEKGKFGARSTAATAEATPSDEGKPAKGKPGKGVKSKG